MNNYTNNTSNADEIDFEELFDQFYSIKLANYYSLGLILEYHILCFLQRIIRFLVCQVYTNNTSPLNTSHRILFLHLPAPMMFHFVTL